MVFQRDGGLGSDVYYNLGFEFAAGVAVVVDNDMVKFIKDIEPLNSRMIAISFKPQSHLL